MRITRREAIAAGLAAAGWAARPAAPAKRMGIAATTYALRARSTSAKHPPFRTALEFLEHARGHGAGGIQVGVRGWTADFVKAFRERRERLGMYFEAQIGLPKDEADAARFEVEVRTAREAGAAVIRTVALSGRRYETFESAEAWKRFREGAWKSLTLADPVAKRHGARLAVENHKDWRVGEFVEILGRLSSAHVGVCLDTGNNLALLEEPMETVGGLARFALSVHLKDMAVQECEDGFLLSEVPLGEGILDLPGVVEACLKANPAVEFNLEMITRDPLRVPCLTPRYWATLEGAPGAALARTLALVRAKAWKKPLPRITGLSPEEQVALEEEHVRRCFASARARLGL